MFFPTKENIKQLLDESEHLADDVKDWLLLRLQLVKIDAELQINGIIQKVVLVILGLILLFFASVTLALGIGFWLGHAFYGFLSVTIILILSLLLIIWRKPTFFRIKAQKIEEVAEKGIQIAHQKIKKLK